MQRNSNRLFSVSQKIFLLQCINTKWTHLKLRFSGYMFTDLVKPQIPHYRNARCYYYILTPFPSSETDDPNISTLLTSKRHAKRDTAPNPHDLFYIHVHWSGKARDTAVIITFSPLSLALRLTTLTYPLFFLPLNAHTPYVRGFAWSDMVHDCIVYTELALRQQQFHVAPGVLVL